MSDRTLIVRIDADESTTWSVLARTLAGIGRAGRSLRRADGDLEIVVAAPSDVAISLLDVTSWGRHHRLAAGVIDPASPDAWTPTSDYVALCRAGEIVDPRFLAAAVQLLSTRTSPAVVHAEHVLVTTDSGPVLLRTPDTRREAIPLEAVVDGDPWPGPRVMASTLLRELCGARANPATADEDLTRASLRAGVPQLTVPSISVVDARCWAREADGVGMMPLAELEAGLVALAPPSAAPGSLDAWERQHPLASGPIRVVRRGRGGLLRRARALRGRLRDRLSRADAQRRLRSLGAPEARLPELSVDTSTGAARRGVFARLVTTGWRDLGRADVLLVTPRVSSRSDDQVALQYARALRDGSGPAARIVLMTTGIRESTESGIIPPEVSHYPAPPEFAGLDHHTRAAAIAQLAVVLGARHVVVVDDDLVEPSVRLRLSTDVSTTVWVHVRSVDIPLSASRNGSPAPRSRIIAEGPRAAAFVAAHVGVDVAGIAIHVPPPLPVMPDFDSVTQYTAAYDDVDFDDEHPFHLLWRSTEDDDARRLAPLPGLAAALRERGLPVRVHLHREVGADTATSTATAGSSAEGIEDEGEFTAGLRDVPSENYHALLSDRGHAGGRAFTLQAMLLGLPVVACGGTADDLSDPDTAAVTAECTPDDLADAVEMLLRSRDLRRRLIRDAYDRARALVDADPFAHAVRRDIRLD